MPSLMHRVRRSVRPSTFGPRFELLETRQLLAATVVQAPPAVTGAATTSLNVDLSTYLNDPAGNTTVKTRLIGANLQAKTRGEKRLAAKINYFIGSDPKNSLVWRAILDIEVHCE